MRMTLSCVSLARRPNVESPSNPKRTTRSVDLPRSISATACVPPLPRDRATADSALRTMIASRSSTSGSSREAFARPCGTRRSDRSRRGLVLVAEVAEDEVVAAACARRGSGAARGRAPTRARRAAGSRRRAVAARARTRRRRSAMSAPEQREQAVRLVRRRGRRGRPPGSRPRSTTAAARGRRRGCPARSMPMPNALVATTTASLRAAKRVGDRRARSSPVMPAW